MSQRKPAIFLDRDGVINQSRLDYVKAWDEFQFYPSAFEAFRLIKKSPYLAVVITNQSAINRGIAARETIEDIHRKMIACVEREGGRIDAVYYCPHRPDEGCTCRKPKPALFLKAAEEMNIDLGESFCIGDKLSDLVPAQQFGCHGLLVRTGEFDRQESHLCTSYPVVDDLLAGVERILSSKDQQ